MSRPILRFFVTMLYIFNFIILFGYCRMAPALAGAIRGFEIGEVLNYDLTTTMLFSETNALKRSAGDVGFQITGKVELAAIWKDSKKSNFILLSIKLLSPQLWIRSRKSPEPEGFIEHSSKLENMPSEPILALWNNGEIEKLFATSDENFSSLNLKRGLASLFQYKTFDGNFMEKDASGLCNVTYHSMGPRSFEKIKNSCTSKYVNKKIENSNPILGVNLTSVRISIYDLTHALLPREIIEDESHDMKLNSRPEAGTKISTHRILRLNPGERKIPSITASNYREAIVSFKTGYNEVSIELQQEKPTCPESGCDTLEQTLENVRSALGKSNLGTTKSASAFLKLLPLVRDANVEQLSKLLKSPKNRGIKMQLLDLLGAASTIETHQAAMKILRQDETGEETERYLWSLSVSQHPNPDIIKNILTRSEETMSNDKLSETYALTAAAMAKRYGSPAILEKVKTSLEIGMDTCTGEECQLKFLRAIGNLGSKTAIPLLLTHAHSGTKTMSIVAWKALGALKSDYITGEIKSAAFKTFFQLGPRKDSSVRLLALNVILQNNPSVDDLQSLLNYLRTRDPVYEVKKYLSQRLQQLSDTDLEFRKKFKEAKKREIQKINNYNFQAIRGLSTALARDFLKSTGCNGSLISIQETSSGLLKRGVVDIVLEKDSYKSTFFSLGLFAGGLTGFVSSSNEAEEINSFNDEDIATAGMELSILDVNIRPFVFFVGQGELMGHVWSGTASERTPAFQIIANLHHHQELIALGTGFITEIEVDSALSFELAGQMQLSLWSRSAECLVDMGAGLVIQGSSKVRSDFVLSKAEFLLTLEPKLNLASDVDFSGRVSLCMRLTQPETIIKYHVYKVERIPGSRHRLRKTRRSKIIAPGKTYFLNRKNNEMCEKVFS